jgi:uncharacterized protein YuzE
MKYPYLEVTYRHGLPLAAYLYLPRQAGEKSCKTTKASQGLIIDFGESGNPIGIEITAPSKVTAEEINGVLEKFGLSRISNDELSPLRAA